MKKIIFASLLLAGISIFSACDNSKKKEEATTSTNGTGGNSDNSGTSTDTGGSSGNITGNSSVATTDTTPKAGGNISDMDKAGKDFISKAASAGMMEIELGNMAAQKAQNPRVKNFGSMMVTDHTQANNELKSIASGKNIAMPATMLSEHQHQVNMIKNKTGTAFDKEYMKIMLDDHKKDVNEFKQASANLKNADLKAFAGKTLPILQKHLDSAQAIHAKM